MTSARPIELVSPAKNLECGIEAVKHGADAVYIGSPKFSARSAAGNSIDDIHKLCDFAHLFNVRIYVALNTILTDDELIETERIIWELYDVGIDALIVQDFGITQLSLPPLALHASTQMDNRTPEKVRLLQELGFKQVVLARELSLAKIAAISDAAKDITIEAFVHGSLCAGYSGCCYLSAAMTGRSANRGECAQCCRLPFSLLDAEGRVIIVDKHFLSLKDLNRSDSLEAMMLAGVSSFKIEGRLKDVSYVKNITAFYRQRLDTIFAVNPAYCRSSAGNSTYNFTPTPDKSFNRGFTNYFLHSTVCNDRSTLREELGNIHTPKSTGELLGEARFINSNVKKKETVSCLRIQKHNKATNEVHAGDGLVFINTKGELQGFRVNKVEGDMIFPYKPPVIKPGTLLYRNYDNEFETLLSKPSAERKLSAAIKWFDYPDGFMLTMEDETGAMVTIAHPFIKEIARLPQNDNIRVQLTKLGNSSFNASEITISMSANYFVPSSILSVMRREATERLVSLHKIRYRKIYKTVKKMDDLDTENLKRLGGLLRSSSFQQDYTANVHNRKAGAFYERLGVLNLQPSFENKPPDKAVLMTTKRCVKYSLGWCSKMQKSKCAYKEPFYLLYKETLLKLSFDCNNCEMLVSI